MRTNEEKFILDNQGNWNRLSALCDVFAQGSKNMPTTDLKEFVRLYRLASRDLATLRTQSQNLVQIQDLNDLVGRAYALLYREPKRNLFVSAYEGLQYTARAFRRQFLFILAAFVLTLGSSFFAAGLTATKPHLRDILVGAQGEGMIEQWTQKGTTEPTEDLSEAFTSGVFMSAFYATNNPRVSLIAGAVGAGTMGVGSLYMLYTNGTILGVLGLEMARVGRLGYLLSSIAPHGVPELSGIFVAGGTGLRLGWALFFPGRFSRGESLRRIGKDALALIVASIWLCLIAAPIEGFFSFSEVIPQSLKVIVACLEVIFWAFFWTLFGRNSAKARAEEEAIRG